MTEYAIKIKTDKVFDRKALEALEDVVYDVVVDNLGGSEETDVEAVFD